MPPPVWCAVRSQLLVVPGTDTAQPRPPVPLRGGVPAGAVGPLRYSLEALGPVCLGAAMGEWACAPNERELMATRARCARTTPPTATPGTRSPSRWPRVGRTAGARTALPAFRTFRTDAELTAQGQPSAAVLHPRAVERQGPDPEGAPVRPQRLARCVPCRAELNPGNHGEDVKEMYYYLDSTPTHSYMKFLYKYPQGRFPYEQLQEESRNRSREVNEFELMDTDMFDEDRYWDIFVEVRLGTTRADPAVRQGRGERRRYVHPHHRVQPRARPRRPPHPPPNVLPQHVVVVEGDAQERAGDAPGGGRRDPCAARDARRDAPVLHAEPCAGRPGQGRGRAGRWPECGPRLAVHGKRDQL